jgi:hypothetical protein
VDIDGNSKKAGKRPPSGSSMVSGYTNPYSNLIDSSRIERLLTCFTLIQSQRTRIEIVKKTLMEVRNLISISNCTIFVLETDLLKTLELCKPDTDGLRCHRFVLDGHPVTGVSLSDIIGTPMFAGPEQVKFGMKT